MVLTYCLIILFAISTTGLNVTSKSSEEDSVLELTNNTEATYRTLVLAGQLFLKIVGAPRFVIWYSHFAYTVIVYDSFNTKITSQIERMKPEEPDADEEKLTIVSGDVKKVIANVKGEGVMTRYSYDEKVIRSSLQSLDAYLEVQNSEFLKEEFFSDAKKLKASISHLMSGLLGELVGGDILLTIKDVVECNGTKYQETVKTILDLLATGIKVHANYINLKNISARDNGPFQREMENNTEKIIQRVQSIGESCRSEPVEDVELRRTLRGWTPQNEIVKFNDIAHSNY